MCFITLIMLLTSTSRLLILKHLLFNLLNNFSVFIVLVSYLSPDSSQYLRIPAKPEHFKRNEKQSIIIQTEFYWLSCFNKLLTNSLILSKFLEISLVHHSDLDFLPIVSQRYISPCFPSQLARTGSTHKFMVFLIFRLHRLKVALRTHVLLASYGKWSNIKVIQTVKNSFADFCWSSHYSKMYIFI